jgi:hypothetical protein
MYVSPLCHLISPSLSFQDTPTVREGKIFSLLLGLQNDVGNIIVAAPAFSVSPELQVRLPPSL